MITFEKLDRLAPGSVEILGAGPNDAGEIRLAVASAANMASGDHKKVSGVQGTVETNGYWPITAIDEKGARTQRRF